VTRRFPKTAAYADLRELASEVRAAFNEKCGSKSEAQRLLEYLTGRRAAMTKQQYWSRRAAEVEQLAKCREKALALQMKVQTLLGRNTTTTQPVWREWMTPVYGPDDPVALDRVAVETEAATAIEALKRLHEALAHQVAIEGGTIRRSGAVDEQHVKARLALQRKGLALRPLKSNEPLTRGGVAAHIKRQLPEFSWKHIALLARASDGSLNGKEDWESLSAHLRKLASESRPRNS